MSKDRSEKAGLKRRILKKISDGAIITGVVMFTLLAGGLYWWQFGAYDWSKDPSDWADLATYISGTIGVFVVASTLVVLVRTLDKQRDLIESQNTMLEKQERQLEQSEEIIRIERSKADEMAKREAKEAENAAIYMIHHFENLKNMLERAPNAFSNSEGQYFLALYEKHPAFYSSFLFEEDAEVVSFINRMDVDMARCAIGAIVHSKHFADVVSHYVSMNCRGDVNSFRASFAINQMTQERKDFTLSEAAFGLEDCQCFLDKAHKLI